MDGIFYYTGRGLNWDMYGHNPGSSDRQRQAALHAGRQRLQHRRAPTAINYFEWCQDHNKPLEAAPVRRCRRPAVR